MHARRSPRILVLRYTIRSNRSILTFSPLCRESHTRPTNYAYPSGIHAWRRVFLPRIIEFQRRDEGAFVTLGETRPILNESRSIGKLFDCQKDKPSSGEGESEKVRFQSDLDFFAWRLIIIVCTYIVTWSVFNDRSVLNQEDWFWRDGSKSKNVTRR